MAHTNFKYAIPYNTIRLGGDVAQWSLYEKSYQTDPNFSGSIGITNISLADMQRASSTNVDPAAWDRDWETSPPNLIVL